MLKLTDPASIEAAGRAFYSAIAVDTALNACPGQTGHVDRGHDLAGIKRGQGAGRGKTEHCCCDNNPDCDKGNLALHDAGLQSALITLTFPPQLAMDPYIGNLMVHCNIAHAAKGETVCRMPLTASAARH
jgi:hypothetical protein